MNPSISLCIISHNRPIEVRDAIASADGQGADEIVLVDMATEPPLEPIDGIVPIRFDHNVGYPTGRNVAEQTATGDVVVFLDDDAVFLEPGALDAVRTAFASDPELGALAGRVRRADGTTVSHEHPFRGPVRDPERPRPCGYFVGAVHAVRRVAWDAAGGIDERYFYSTEEIDLSLALAGRGWHLRYEPRLVVEHRPSPRGRVADPELPAMRWRNRLWLVRRHLPWPVAFVHAAVWAARTWREATATGDRRPWWRATRDGLAQPVARERIGYRRLVAIHRDGGRVLW